MHGKTLLDHISILPDPGKRNHGKIRHEFKDIIIIAILATICGADSWVEIAEFGRAREKWLRDFLSLPNGVPSHDTFGRIFSILDGKVFEYCFTEWARSLGMGRKSRVIALDGKSVRRSREKNRKPLHLVSAFAAEEGIVLGQRKVDGKTNEITAIPELLETLYLRGAIVTADAMATQGWIVRKVIENKGDYVLTVKGNQRRLLADVKRTFENSPRGTSVADTSERSHGRQETRECAASDDLSMIRDRERWVNVRSIVRVTAGRKVGDRTYSETRYFISSMKADAKEFLRVIRAHWKTENSLHWSLDMAFREDESRVRIGHAGENLALVRKMAMNLLRKSDARIGIKAKRMRAAWDEEFLWSVIEAKG